MTTTSPVWYNILEVVVMDDLLLGEEAPLRTCCKCKKALSLDSFGKDSQSKDGLLRACRECRSKSFAKWRAVNADYDTERGKRYREENIDRERERYRTYDAAHRQERRVKAKKRWDELSDEEKKKSSERAIAFRKNNPSRARQFYQVKQNNNRTTARGNDGTLLVREWDALMKKYDYRCVCCGEKKKLTIDHVIPVSKGGGSEMSNVQPLCRECNRMKGVRSVDFRKKWEPEPLLGE